MMTGLNSKCHDWHGLRRLKIILAAVPLLGCLAYNVAAQSPVTALHSAVGYITGDPGTTTLIVTNVVTYPDTYVLNALYLTNMLPPGWTLSQNTWGPGVREVQTNFNEITFVETLPTNNPLVFSYEVIVPANQTGLHHIASILGYRFQGDDDATEIPMNPAPLELKMNIQVSAVATGKVYGAVDPPLTYTVTAGTPMSGDSFTGALARVAGENAGTYEIQQGTLGINSNYVIVFTPDDFTISPLPVAVGGTREYDGTTTAQFSILDVTNKVGSDDVDFVSGSGTLASSNVGLRAITSFDTLALGGAQSLNYTLTGATGVVEITQAQATVNLSNLAQVYNGAARVVGVTTVPAGLSYSLTYAGNAWAPTNAGSYEVIALITDGNYSGGSTGTLTVSRLPVKAGGTRAYNGTATALYTILDVTNRVGSDAVDFVSGSGTLASPNVGLRAITSFGTLALGGAQAANYTLTGASGAVRITGTPPVITVHPQSVTVDVGSAVGFIVRATGTPTLTYQWQKNGANIAGATSSNYNIAAAALSHAGQYRCRVSNSYGAATSRVAVLTVRMKPTRRVINDFDGDGKSDGVIIHTSAVWKAVFSSMSYTPEYTIWNSGLKGWLNVPGDYDADFRTDGGMYNPATGSWKVYLNTTPPQLLTAQYGSPADLPVQADYDGDLKTDPWLYNPQTRVWKGLKSSQNYAVYTMPFTLGGPGFRPVPEDYDADGKADPAVYSETTGEWIVAMSGSGYQKINMFFGGPDNAPVPMDYDGDGMADPAIYGRYTGLWQVAMSGQGYVIVSAVLGTSRCLPIMADYDGDGKADPALYQLSTGFWRVYLSSQNYALMSGYFGNWQYTPVTESVACRP